MVRCSLPLWVSSFFDKKNSLGGNKEKNSYKIENGGHMLKKGMRYKVYYYII